MNDLLETIESYYEEYLERMKDDPQYTPLSKDLFIKQICYQLDYFVSEQVYYLAENHP